MIAVLCHRPLLVLLSARRHLFSGFFLFIRFQTRVCLIPISSRLHSLTLLEVCRLCVLQWTSIQCNHWPACEILHSVFGNWGRLAHSQLYPSVDCKGSQVERTREPGRSNADSRYCANSCWQLPPTVQDRWACRSWNDCQVQHQGFRCVNHPPCPDLTSSNTLHMIYDMIYYLSSCTCMVVVRKYPVLHSRTVKYQKFQVPHFLPLFLSHQIASMSICLTHLNSNFGLK